MEEAKPAASGGQEAFGQFLLRPISQRPWDAVKDLETVNKELQDQPQQGSKQPSVDKCIEDLNEAYKDILELGTASNKVPNGSVQIPERIKIRLSSEPLNKPSSLRRSAVSWSVDPEYRELKSAFSRPATKSVTFSKQLREELPVPPRETGFREYRVIPHLSRRRSSSDGRTVKLDLSDEPVLMPICDFSPSTNTTAEVPWADRQPMQDASTLTSPPDYEDICQTLRQSRDSDINTLTAGSSKSNDGQPSLHLNVESEEDCPICKREFENRMRQGPLPPLHEENSSDSSANQNGSPPQFSALSPAEEPIDIPAESRATGKPVTTEKELAEKDAMTGNSTDSTAVKKKAGVKDACEGPDSATPENRQDLEKKPLALPDHRLVLRTQLGRDHPGLPEFPPDRLPLSVLPNPDRRLSLSLEGERRGRGAPSHVVEALQDKMAASPSRAAFERPARMREVDTVYRMRRLSIRSNDSGEGEAERESKEAQPVEAPPASQRDKEDDKDITSSCQAPGEAAQLDEEAACLSEPGDTGQGRGQ
ncbi:hypothetical protein CRUP_036681 [Coryphaenoides rupestris]|nr:hypothetical protein CRUP_036681 [Coryphaenoides rupestris]